MRGILNEASGLSATVGGGLGNVEGETHSTVAGGSSNEATNVASVVAGDPDTDDDGMLDQTGNTTAVPFGTIRYDVSADKGQMFVSDSDGSGTDGWIDLH